jgi:hypothetical protein
MARSAMRWIINELRRKVHDTGVGALEPSVRYAGDTIKLSQQFKTVASVAATVANAKITVLSPTGDIVVSSASCVISTVKSWASYNLRTTSGYTEGVYLAEFVGSVAAIQRRYPYEFELRKTQRIWSDDELQAYLDKHRVFVGVGRREELGNDLSYKRYLSNFDTFEWVKLYDTADGLGVEATPDTSNLVAGEWVFNTAQDKTLYLEGYSYNIYASAAECLEELAGDDSRSSQWTRGGVSHKSQDPLKLAQYYRYMSTGIKSTEINKVYARDTFYSVRRVQS